MNVTKKVSGRKTLCLFLASVTNSYLLLCPVFLIFFYFYFSSPILSSQQKSFQNLTNFLKSMRQMFNIPKLCKIHLIASLLNLHFHFPTAVFIKLVIFCRARGRIPWSLEDDSSWGPKELDTIEVTQHARTENIEYCHLLWKEINKSKKTQFSFLKSMKQNSD